MAQIHAYEIPEAHSQLARSFAIAGLAVTDTKRIVYATEEDIILAIQEKLNIPKMRFSFTEAVIQSPFWNIPLEIVNVDKDLVGLILPAELMVTLHSIGSQVFDATGKLTPRRKLISSSLLALEQAFDKGMSEILEFIPSGVARRLPV